MIFLYHLASSKEAYEEILKNGLMSSSAQGKPVPTHPEMAKKSFDIFFHPLRENEGITDLPIGSIADPKKSYFVGIAVPPNSSLQVNNRLYSFGMKPLNLCSIDEFYKSSSYSQEGLPECRITVDCIPPEYIAIHGTIEKFTEKDTVTPFPLKEQNLRFAPERSTNRLKL